MIEELANVTQAWREFGERIGSFQTSINTLFQDFGGAWREIQRSRTRYAKQRARLVTWHKGNKKRLTRREKVARGIPRGR